MPSHLCQKRAARLAAKLEESLSGDTVVVLRIEDDRGRGPYNHDAGPDSDEARDLAYTAYMPSPWDIVCEPILGHAWNNLSEGGRGQYIFGFEGREQMRRHWSPELTKALRLLGWGVHFYEVDAKHLTYGCTQVFFHKQYARRLR